MTITIGHLNRDTCSIVSHHFCHVNFNASTCWLLFCRVRARLYLSLGKLGAVRKSAYSLLVINAEYHWRLDRTST
jgi:hypothetical protein